MEMRRGQVAIYLALVLVVITLLLLMNVSVFLGVSAKNATMNAGDAAAIAVANHQRDLLNRIGRLNVEHLKAAVKGDSKECERCVVEQLQLSFLGPIEGLIKGDLAAKQEADGLEVDEELVKFLRDHATFIRNEYAMNEEMYPAPWKGAWEAYASALEVAVSNDLVVGPDNIDFMNPVTGHILLNRNFYEAIAGRSWCWFKLYMPGLLDNYTNFRDWSPLPSSDDETRRRKCVNSEIYSLGLELRSGSAIKMLGTKLIAELTGKSEAELRGSRLLEDPTQSWFFYDLNVWRQWVEMDPMREDSLPLMGRVKEEYDTRGSAAICRVSKTFVNLVEEGLGSTAVWSGAAKPFGTIKNATGDAAVVTSLAGFVTECFTEAKLVPLDSVGGRDLATADAEWMYHVRKHLPEYYQNGPNRAKDCRYCRQLVLWERPSFRSEGRRWIKLHGSECYRPAATGGGRGGTSHGH